MTDPHGLIPPGIKARLAWQILSALLLGGWLLYRSFSKSSLVTARAETRARFVRGAAVALSFAWTLIWIALALVRMRYPYELEWIGGAMRDHVSRILAGQPIYAAPTAQWIPIEYPPLYYYVSAGLCWITGGSGFTPMRLISIASTFGCARLLYLWVCRRLGAPVTRVKVVRLDASGAEIKEEIEAQREIGRTARAWAWIAVGVMFAAYRTTGAWYDVERIDMLFMFLSMLGLYLVELSLEPPYELKRLGGYAALGAVALSAAFFTKQQALLFTLGVITALAWRRAWPQLAIFGVVTLVVCGDAVMLANALSDGWFGYYCMKIPSANGVHPSLLIAFVFVDMPLLAPLIAIVIAAAVARRRRPAIPDEVFEREEGGGDAVLVAATATALIGSFVSRGHWGGDSNVLIPVYLMAAATASVVAGRWELRNRRTAAPLALLAMAQIVGMTYRPDAQAPSSANYGAGARYTQIVNDMEQGGKRVFCPEHGGFTTPPRFQIMALGDIVRAEHAIPPAVSDAIRERYYDAILTDDPPKPGTPFDDLLIRNYAPAERPGIPGPWVVTGFATPQPNGQIYVLRPRK